MRSLAVVVLDVDARDVFEVATAEDQQVVETLRSDGAGEALGVGVRLRRADRCVDDADAFAAEYVVEGSGEPAVAVVDQRASSRCQRRSVAGVTISPRRRRCGSRRASAAMNARSADRNFGR